MTRIYECTKTYGHERGFTTVFRQWRANSHCRFLHGYALSFKFEMCTQELDERNWVYDFGNMKPVENWLKDSFDHTLLIAEDDPNADELLALEQDFGLAKVVMVPSVGCESIAAFAGDVVGRMIWRTSQGRVWLHRCTVAEHGSNSAGVAYAKEEWQE